jgi:nucleosome assembly protein 1-like 1
MDEPQIPHFMPGGLGGVKRMSQEEIDQQDFKITKYIDSMDPEVRDRFKALQAIAFICKGFDDEETKEIKELELQFENRYKEIYALRDALINEKTGVDMNLVAQFNERAKKMKDEDYDKLEVNPCDVKAIQNCKGVSDFWIRTLLNHSLGQMISERDRPILGYLQNIDMNLHKDDAGFDLIFTFAPNNYFKETVITKTLVMQDKGVLDSTTSTPITWNDGCNPTVKKQKKKKAGKKVTVESECESFFNIFKTLTQPDESSKTKSNEDDEEDMDDEVQEKLADDLEIAEMIKEDVIPLALEYYLGVIENEGPEDDDHDHANCDHDHDDDDGEDDGDKKKKKKGGKKQMQMGPDGKP